MLELLVALMAVLAIWAWLVGREVRPVPSVESVFREPVPAPSRSTVAAPPPGASASPPSGR